MSWTAPLPDDYKAYECLRDFLKRVQYKPGWALRAKAPTGPFERAMLTWTFIAPDARNPEQTVVVEGEAQLSTYDTHDEILRTFVWATLLAVEEHEAGEWFQVDGDRPFDPHRQRTAPPLPGLGDRTE